MSVLAEPGSPRAEPRQIERRRSKWLLGMKKSSPQSSPTLSSDPKVSIVPTVSTYSEPPPDIADDMVIPHFDHPVNQRAVSEAGWSESDVFEYEDEPLRTSGESQGEDLHS